MPLLGIDTFRTIYTHGGENRRLFVLRWFIIKMFEITKWWYTTSCLSRLQSYRLSSESCNRYWLHVELEADRDLSRIQNRFAIRSMFPASTSNEHMKISPSISDVHEKLKKFRFFPILSSRAEFVSEPTFSLLSFYQRTQIEWENSWSHRWNIS